MLLLLDAEIGLRVEHNVELASQFIILSVFLFFRVYLLSVMVNKDVYYQNFSYRHRTNCFTTTHLKRANTNQEHCTVRAGSCVFSTAYDIDTCWRMTVWRIATAWRHRRLANVNIASVTIIAGAQNSWWQRTECIAYVQYLRHKHN